MVYIVYILCIFILGIYFKTNNKINQEWRNAASTSFEQIWSEASQTIKEMFL